MGLNNKENIISVVALIDCFIWLYHDLPIILLAMNALLFRVLLVYRLVSMNAYLIYYILSVKFLD